MNDNKSKVVLQRVGDPAPVTIDQDKCVIRTRKANRLIDCCAIFNGPQGTALRSYTDDVLVNGEPSIASWLRSGDQIQLPCSTKLDIKSASQYRPYEVHSVSENVAVECPPVVEVRTEESYPENETTQASQTPATQFMAEDEEVFLSPFSNDLPNNESDSLPAISAPSSLQRESVEPAISRPSVVDSAPPRPIDRETVFITPERVEAEPVPSPTAENQPQSLVEETRTLEQRVASVFENELPNSDPVDTPIVDPGEVNEKQSPPQARNESYANEIQSVMERLGVITGKPSATEEAPAESNSEAPQTELPQAELPPTKSSEEQSSRFTELESVFQRPAEAQPAEPVAMTLESPTVESQATSSRPSQEHESLAHLAAAETNNTPAAEDHATPEHAFVQNNAATELATEPEIAAELPNATELPNAIETPNSIELPSDLQNQLNDLVTSLESLESNTNLDSAATTSPLPRPGETQAQPDDEPVRRHESVPTMTLNSDQPWKAETDSVSQVALTQPEPESVTVEAPQTAQPSSVADILSNMGMSVPGDDEEANEMRQTPNDAPEPQPVQEAQAPTEPKPSLAPEQTSEVPALAVDSDDDIQAYMDRLLNRKSSEEVESEMVAEQEAAAAIASAPKPEPVKVLSPEEFVPTHRAARHAKFEDLREIANSSSRTAILQSTSKARTESIIVKSSLFILSFAGALLSYQLSMAIPAIAFAGATFATSYLFYQDYRKRESELGAAKTSLKQASNK